MNDLMLQAVNGIAVAYIITQLGPYITGLVWGFILLNLSKYAINKIYPSKK